MTVYMVFLRNMASNEDFAVPTEAESPQEALLACQQRHPHPLFSHLTTFPLDDVQRMVEDARRWPGVASTVQPSVDDMLKRVNVRIGKLPPLPGQHPTAARVEHDRGFSRGVMDQQARMAAAPATVPVPASKPRMAPAAAPASLSTPSHNHGRSVVDVLRALRG